MEELVGKKILSLSVDGERQHILSFETSEGPISYYADGDCCSESWFADITGVSAMVGGTVSRVDEISMDGYNVKDGRGRQEDDMAYGYKIVTDKGYGDIVFRNSSNGYYGGSIGPHKGELPASMVPITDDWQAGKVD